MKKSEWLDGIMKRRVVRWNNEKERVTIVKEVIVMINYALKVYHRPSVLSKF